MTPKHFGAIAESTYTLKEAILRKNRNFLRT